MAHILAALSTILHYACWPLLALSRAVTLALAPVWAIVQFGLLPLTHSARAVVSIALFPFRLHVLDRIETIYIYLGIASIIGCMAGAFLHFSFRFLSSALSIDAHSESRARASATPRPKAETLHHAADPPIPHPIPPLLKTTPGSPRRRRLLSQPIIEEDSDF